MTANPNLTDVVLMCSAVNAVDISALESLKAIEHRLKDANDGAGFDILSFDPAGKERLIEVKTATGAAQTPLHRQATA